MKANDATTRILVSSILLLLALFTYVYGPLHIDKVTFAFILAAAAPWLSLYFKSVKIPNIIELELQELRKGLDEAKGAAQSANQVATFAASSPTPIMAATNGQPASESAELQRLAAEYNHIRETQKSGSARTREMTEVVRKMAALAPNVKEYDPRVSLKSDDRGERLTAFAYLFSEPEFDLLDELVDSLTTKEDKPFGQYWALKAIQRVVGSQGEQQISSNVVRQLQAFQGRLSSGTDRDYELKRILEEIKGPADED
jgi:hypothetical protein